jgi:ribosomal protein S18 acetylase RimI-like enzyme
MPLIPASDGEMEEIAHLVNRAYRGGEGWTHESDYLDGQRTDAATLRADLAAAPQARILTLRDSAEGPLLGAVWLEPAAAETAWYLGMLTVRPDLQDRRLGRQLLEDAERYGAERGALKVRITVVNVRASLIAWYERRGYGLTGETEPFPYQDQRFGAPRRDDLMFVVLEKTVNSLPDPGVASASQ